MIRTFKSSKLARFWLKGDASKLPREHIAKIQLILDVLDQARSADDVNRPSFAFHALKGKMKGRYAVTVRANWRITFAFDAVDAIDVDYEDYHLRHRIMGKTLRHPALRPSHPGELLAADIEAMKARKTDVARHLGITRKMLYDLLDGKCGVTANMALRLEAVFGSSAEMWIGMQVQHDLWKARQKPAPKKLKRFVAA